LQPVLDDKISELVARVERDIDFGAVRDQIHRAVTSQRQEQRHSAVTHRGKARQALNCRCRTGHPSW
jgi:hypothetical protein